MEENKLVKWFINYFENKINEEYLYLENFNCADAVNAKFNKATIIDLENFREYSSKANYILHGFITNDSKNKNISSSAWLKENKKQIICVKSNENLLDAIKSKNIDEIRKFNYHLIEKIDFYKVLEIQDIKSFLQKRNKEISLENDILELILKDKLFNTEIELLKKHDILTANFANKIYRLCQLDFYSTATDIGNKIRKILNSKSRSITGKKLKEYLNSIDAIDKLSMPIKQTRIYDLNINQIEIDTKMRIAKNLLSLRKEKLDYKTIAKVTELPEKVINNILFSSFK